MQCASTLANLRGKERFSSQALNELYTENPDDEVVAEAYIRGLHNLSGSQKDVNIRLVCFNEAERVFKQFPNNEKIASSFIDFASQISYYCDCSDCSNAEKFLDKVEEVYLAFSWNEEIAFNYATAQTHALCALKKEVGEFKFLDYSDAVKYYKEILKNQKEKLQ